MRRPAKGRFALKRVPKLELRHEGKYIGFSATRVLPTFMTMKTIGKTLLVLLTLFLVAVGFEAYNQHVRISRIREMDSPESRKAALKEAEADALSEVMRGNVDVHSAAQERRYRLKVAVEQDEAAAKVAAEIQTAKGRNEAAAKAELARQQAAAKAAADAPRLRAQAEEAKRQAAAREIAEKYSGRSK